MQKCWCKKCKNFLKEENAQLKTKIKKSFSFRSSLKGENAQLKKIKKKTVFFAFSSKRGERSIKNKN